MWYINLNFSLAGTLLLSFSLYIRMYMCKIYHLCDVLNRSVLCIGIYLALKILNCSLFWSTRNLHSTMIALFRLCNIASHQSDVFFMLFLVSKCLECFRRENGGVIVLQVFQISSELAHQNCCTLNSVFYTNLECKKHTKYILARDLNKC